VWENVPLESTPEFQTSGPVIASLVDVCRPWKFHVTVSPGATVTVAGYIERPGPTVTV
jgi:hypothetical protein